MVQEPINFDNLKDQPIEDYLYDDRTKGKITLFKRLFYGTASVLALVLMIGAGVYAYKHMAQKQMLSSVPLIKADNTKFKYAPTESGIAPISNLDKKVYKHITEEVPTYDDLNDGMEAAEQKTGIHIVPNHEEPIERNVIHERVAEKIPAESSPIAKAKDLAEVDEEEVQTILKVLENRQKEIEQAAQEIQQEIDEVEISANEEKLETISNKESTLIPETQEVIKPEPTVVTSEASITVEEAESKEELETVSNDNKKNIEVASKQVSKETATSEAPVDITPEEDVHTVVRKEIKPLLEIKDVSKAKVKKQDPESIVSAARIKKEEKDRVVERIQKILRYRVQLGAFKSEKDAKDAWSRIQKANKESLTGLPSNIERADLGSKGIFYRLQAGLFNKEADARRLCTKLLEKQQGCFVVK